MKPTDTYELAVKLSKLAKSRRLPGFELIVKGAELPELLPIFRYLRHLAAGPKPRARTKPTRSAKILKFRPRGDS